jgi:hypothetical protein
MTIAGAGSICTVAGSKSESGGADRGQVHARPSPLGSSSTMSWLLRFKRLGLRYDRTERTTLPLLTLACAVINVRRLIKSEF